MQGQNKYVQISQLADDTTLFIKDEGAVIRVLKKVMRFGKVSGVKLNREKTDGLWLGEGKTEKMSLGVLNGIKTI